MRLVQSHRLQFQQTQLLPYSAGAPMGLSASSVLALALEGTTLQQDRVNRGSLPGKRPSLLTALFSPLANFRETGCRGLLRDSSCLSALS